MLFFLWTNSKHMKHMNEWHFNIINELVPASWRAWEPVETHRSDPSVFGRF